MKIEEGKYYRTRNGRKFGPMESSSSKTFPFQFEVITYTSDGFYHPASGASCFDLIAEWTDESKTPKRLCDMTDAEIGAIVRAMRWGATVELYSEMDEEWMKWDGLRLHDVHQLIRIRPEQIAEPTRETVTLLGHNASKSGWSFAPYDNHNDTHRITFDLIDGKPDPASIKLEALK